MIRQIFIVLLSCCSYLVTVAQDISVRALLDTNKGLIGDQFRLRLQVEKPVDSWHVVFPVIDDSLVNSIEVLKVNPVDTSNAGTKQLLTQDLLITVFDTGFFKIPPLSFGISHAGISDTLKSLPVYFEIQAMKADSTIRDIKGIYKVPLSFREIAPYLAGFILLALVVWLVVRYLKNRPVRELQEKTEILSEPADVIALRELAQLREEKPWQNNRVKYYYSRVSDILRTYIERRYEFLAMEQTTGEIMNSLTKSGIDKDEKARLGNILSLADLVKFAKVIPDPESNAQIIGQAEDFVRNTKVVSYADLQTESK